MLRRPVGHVPPCFVSSTQVLGFLGSLCRTINGLADVLPHTQEKRFERTGHRGTEALAHHLPNLNETHTLAERYRTQENNDHHQQIAAP
ncbi:hypothetical protein ACVWYH_004817 [Bradyrhizobium sp. GM24.11]